MSVALISLFPLETTGGGELYTIETAQALVACEERAILVAPVDVPATRTDLSARLRTLFVCLDPATDASPEIIEWADVLVRLADHDYVWVHQYLASDFVFDVIASVASDQRLLFTSLGFEPIRPVFADIYQACQQQHVVEISAYAAARATSYAPRAIAVTAGIWRSEVGPLTSPNHRVREYVVLGRVLPHKGIETTIDALRHDETLHVVGPTPDEAYFAFLQQRAGKKQVVFHGGLPRIEVQRLLEGTTGLVSASTHRLFDGRQIEQPELLGLVLYEALREGTLPVSSDVPAFREVMATLGLRDWTFREGDSNGLRTCLTRLAELGPDERLECLVGARATMLDKFTWDDYWPRVHQQIQEVCACG